jgi:4-hydroxy-tetrahydrodipicolinate synthase
LLGSTGEAPSLTIGQRRQITEQVLRMTDPSQQVVVGVSSTCREDSVDLARHARDHGAAAVLCAAPYYFANEPDGILRFLEAVDTDLGIELVFYDNPEATKTRIAAADVVRWSQELEHLGAAKLTDHDLTKVADWHAAGLRVFAGDDPIAFRYLAAGVDGVMIIVPAVFPQQFRRVWDLCVSGDVQQALRVFGQGIAPFSHVFGVGDEIATTKALLARIGVFSSPEVLPPLTPATVERTELLTTAYRLGLEQAGPAPLSPSTPTSRTPEQPTRTATQGVS